VTSLKSQLIGNDLVWERLIQLESKAKLPTAMAFVGPEGVGKLKMAKALVQWTLCDSHSACGVCGPCQRVAADSSEALVVLEPDGEWIKVDQIHELLRQLSLRSLRARRFVVIDPAHKMNSQSSNALLKMLEEPPEGTHFILVTSQVSALLPTIRSRVQSFRFFPLSNEELKTHHQESPDWLLNLSRGQISELEFWAEEEMSEVLNQVEQGLHSLAKKDLEGWLALLPLVKDRKMFYRISKIFQFFFRDLSFEFQEGEYSLPFSKRLKSEFSWPKNGLALAWQRAFELESSIQGNADRSLLFQNFYFDLWSQAEGERL
tara:strand:+ start:4326 stop:5279 length:954 start_codon:yes stop_codon:yes gene_type:complete